MAVCGASEETAPPFILTMSLCVHEACVSMTRASPHLHADYDLPSPQIEMQDGVPHATLFGIAITMPMTAWPKRATCFWTGMICRNAWQRQVI